jgi:hypothetical protein
VDQRSDGSIRLFFALCCWACAGVFFLAISSFAWVLRDGLGLDSVESQGWVAFSRYFKGAGWSLLVPAAFLLAGLLLYRSDAHRSAYPRGPKCMRREGAADGDSMG